MKKFALLIGLSFSVFGCFADKVPNATTDSITADKSTSDVAVTNKATVDNLASTNLKPQETQQLEARMLESLLSNYHYSQSPFDDAKSKEALSVYLEYLDYGKYLFTQADITGFAQYENQLDDWVKSGNLTMIYNIYNSQQNKMLTRLDWVQQRLQQPFNKNTQLVIETDRKKTPWAKDTAELDARWEARLLNEWLTLVLAKKDEADAVETLKKRYTQIHKRFTKVKPEDVLQLFGNAMAAVYDPHSNYFSPQTNEDFEMGMSLSLEGIGAQLMMQEEAITIKELIAGGPAIRSQLLDVDDKILGVGQGEKGPIEDVIGWPLDEAVRLIRGKQGTKVKLLIQKIRSDEIREIVLVRDKIKLEEQAAKSEIKTLQLAGQPYKVGIIELPSFYIDFAAAGRKEKDYRSSTRDVAKLLKDLRGEKIDALMIDLRNNGGGSLYEAINLVGLFIDKGPVVQVISAEGERKVHDDTDSGILYSGPLTVLVNGYSASASEIFAGAIKDYQRGVILGEPTFGKGTVQNVISLSDYLPASKDPLGAVKMTMAMFYRINGSSTQQKGVKPSVYIPQFKDTNDSGESKEPHALAWQETQAARYRLAGNTDHYIPNLQMAYQAYFNHNKALQIYVEEVDYFEALSKEETLSLNYEKRLQKKKGYQDKTLHYTNQLREIYGYAPLALDYLDKTYQDKTPAERQAEKEQDLDVIKDASIEVSAMLAALMQGKSLADLKSQ